MDHGFGSGKLEPIKPSKKRPTVEDKEKIAKCISKVPGVLWSHVVYRQTDRQNSFDLIWEEWERCDDAAIKKCAKAYDYDMPSPHHTTIRDKSYKKNGQEGKHPKKED